MGMPGTKPFFEALWAVMRLQVLPEQLGGAGGRRIRWELDDAVFKEAAYVLFTFYLVSYLWPYVSPPLSHAVAKTSCSKLSMSLKE